MDFGSKYVYKYEHSSDESVSDDDEIQVVEKELSSMESKREENQDRETASSKTTQKRKKRLRKADTNVLTVKFNRLLLPGEMHAGDPVYCSECGAIASHLSQIQPGENSESNWQCEFCPKLNSVDIERTDLPRDEDATYLLSPAPVVHGSDMTGVDDSIVIFLIDISGSMSSTTLVQGAFRMPNIERLNQRAAANFDGERMIRQRHQTFVSRLQGVQMAVDANLDKLYKETPTRRAALLTFNHEITYYGDGKRDEPLVIRGDKLNSAEDLLRESEREQNVELQPISQTKTNLTERVYDLEEGGQTALGPAVMFAINVASKRKGSKIVICTDGLANRGLGNLEIAQDDKADETIKMQALTDGNQFYAALTERAREKGVSISVITIKGTACLLPVIGQMADGTNGSVTIVDLLNIRDEFASILEQKVIATNVEATLVVHRGLYIRNPDDLEDKLEKIKRNIGNVTKQTEVSFEFGVRNKQELKDKYKIDLDQLKHLPFQLQVNYTAVDGSKALRVLTQLKETTENRDIAELNAYRGVIAENHIRSTANQMMLDFDDDEDESSSDMKIIKSKWSKPVMQKQRIAYMRNLNEKKKASRNDDVDEFNEHRWNKASHELNSHVVQSKHRKAASIKPTTIVEKPTSMLSRISNLFSSSTNQEETENKETNSKRGFGFATSNVAFYSDKHSEDLYKFKQISSNYLRSSSPTREEEKSSNFSTAGSMGFETKDKNDDEDQDQDEDVQINNKSKTNFKSKRQSKK